MREDWIECTFEDLLDYEQPTKYIVRSTKYSDDFKIPVLTAGKSFIKGYTNETDCIFNELPTIIFDDFTTATQFVDFPFKVKSSAMKILVPTSKLVNMKFLFNCIQVNQVRNDTHKRYWISVYAKKKILLPPLAEQRAILEKTEELFSDLDNGIANFKKAQEQLKIYRQAVLKKAFEGELTKEWREKQTHLPTAEELLKQIKEERQNHYNQQMEDWKKAVKEWEKNGKVGKKPSKPTALSLNFDLSKSDQELKEIPENWFYITLDFATYKLGDGLHGTPKYDENGEYWFINGNNLNNGKIILKSETKKVNFSEFEKYKKDLNKDTILVSINGTIGNVSFYNDEKVILGKSACYFNLLSSFDKNYIRWLIDSFGFMQYAVRNATGSTIKNVPLSAMRNFVFPLCSTQEQTQIVQEIESRLSVCDKMEQSITESIEKAEALRQSILKKAFEGKLLSEAEIEQCKQAADYEPASELLKKIQAEKLAKEQEKKKKPTVKKKSKK
jgi:type I restriction enzyme, S subunit